MYGCEGGLTIMCLLVKEQRANDQWLNGTISIMPMWSVNCYFKSLLCFFYDWTSYLKCVFYSEWSGSFCVNFLSYPPPPPPPLTPSIRLSWLLLLISWYGDLFSLWHRSPLTLMISLWRTLTSEKAVITTCTWMFHFFYYFMYWLSGKRGWKPGGNS